MRRSRALAGWAQRWPLSCLGSNVPRGSGLPVPREVRITVLAKPQVSSPGSEGRGGEPRAAGTQGRARRPLADNALPSRLSRRRARQERQPHQGIGACPSGETPALAAQRGWERKDGARARVGSQETLRGQGAEETGGKRDRNVNHNLASFQKVRFSHTGPLTPHACAGAAGEAGRSAGAGGSDRRHEAPREAASLQTGSSAAPLRSTRLPLRSPQPLPFLLNSANALGRTEVGSRRQETKRERDWEMGGGEELGEERDSL